METFRKTIKRIAAIGSGALIAASSFGMAGLATDLSDYPAPFVADGKWAGLIAVGADAVTADVIGAVDVAATLAEAVSGGTTVSTEITGGVEEDVPLDTAIDDAFNGPLDDIDIDTLLDSTIEFNDEDLDVHEEITLGAATPNIAISATGDADYGKDPYLEVGAGDVEYTYVFEEVGDWDGNDTADDAVDADNPLEIEFMGKTLTITDVDDDAITAQVGEEFFMSVDDTVTVMGHTVKLINVGDNDAVVVSVDGTQETVTGTEKVGDDLRINVKETFYSDTKAERSATLIIGEDAFKDYVDGDEYIIPCATPETDDCDEDSPDWEWVIDMDELGGTDELGVINTNTWNNDEDPVIAVGEAMYLPDNYVWIKLNELTVDDFESYKIYMDDGVDLTDALAGEDDEIVFIIKGSSDESLSIDTDGDNIVDTETSEIYLWVSTAGNNITALYKDDDNDITAVADDAGSTLDTEDTFAEDPIIFAFVNGDTEQYAAVYGENNAGNSNAFLQINVENGQEADVGDLGANEGDLVITLTMDGANITASTVFEGMNAPEDAEADDVFIDEAANVEIGERDTDVLFEYGSYITVPEDTTDGDEVDLYVPNDVQEVTVLIGSTGTKTTVTGGAGTLSSVSVAKVDTEISSPKDYNLILVGGTAVNRLTAQALGVTYPTHGTEAGTALSIAENQATLKLVEDAFGGTNVALIVAGWEATDTRNAANVLKDYSAYSATLKGKQVVVTSTAGTITLSAPTVAAA